MHTPSDSESDIPEMDAVDLTAGACVHTNPPSCNKASLMSQMMHMQNSFMERMMTQQKSFMDRMVTQLKK